MKRKKVIAFYLPQYHPIPENDKAHGVGFTEWTNVKKATPLYPGHNQPRIPQNDNYYSLLDPAVMRGQAALAKEYGIFGFCYYHYWFKNGKKLLEKPIELMLSDKSIDIPFVLCWANENWTRKWNGENNEIIVEQDYGDLNDLRQHVDYLCAFFRDDRYIKMDGKPILLIYKPEIIPNLKHYIKEIRNRVRENGFPGIVLMSQYPDYFFSCRHSTLFDYHIQFEPKFIQDYEVEKLNLRRRKLKHFMLSHNLNGAYQVLLKKYQKQKKAELVHRDYDKDWQAILDYPVEDDKTVAGAFVDWDNTPRNKNGLVYDGVSVEKFSRYFSALSEKVEREYASDFIFLNAWNEWAEGAYLEPDTRNGLGYLEAIREAVKDV